MFQGKNPNKLPRRGKTSPFAWPWSLSPLGSWVWVAWALFYYKKLIPALKIHTVIERFALQKQAVVFNKDFYKVFGVT